MAQPTVTRRALRDKIALRLGNTFHRTNNGVGDIDSAAADLASVVDDTLSQNDDYWNSRWFLALPAIAGAPAPAGDVRRVMDFTAHDDRLHLDRPLSGSPAAGADYQLFDIFSPYEYHSAINNANREAAKTFFGIQIDEDTIVIEDKKLEYSLASLSPVPWKIYNIWVEFPHSIKRGNPTSATSSTLSDTSNPFGDVTIDAQHSWRVSISKCTGAGQVRTVSAATSGQLTISSAWTTTPDTTSEYSVWDANEQLNDWRQILGVRFDRQEFPSNMYLHARYESFKGMRLRFQYSYKPSDMTDDDDTTPALPEFLEPWAIKEMLHSRVRSNRMDRASTVSDMEAYRVEAEQVRGASEMHEPAMSLWQMDPPNDEGLFGGIDDPMGWRGD